MMRNLVIYVLAVSSVFTAALPAHATVTLMDKDDWKVGFYGFAETDAIFDTTRSLSESIGNSPVDRPSTYPGDNGRTQFSIRNSRLGFLVGAPKAGDWTSKAVMEFDFLGPGAASTTTPEASLFNNPVLRVRHFNFQAESNGWLLLAGQSWTLFGWQPNYFLATLSVAPVTGVLYERTAQFTAIKTVDVSDTQKVSAGLSFARPAQRDSQIPGIDAGLRWAWSGRKSGFVSMTSGDVKAQPLSIGISGRVNEFEYNATTDTATTTHLLGSAIALDALLPILGSSEDNTGNTLTLTGEVTTGRGYAEAFPGFTGNLQAYGSGAPTPAVAVPAKLNVDAGQIGFDPNSGITLVHLTSFNLQLQYHLPSDWMTFVTAGYGQIYSDNIDSLIPAANLIVYDRNETYFLNVGHNLSKQIRVAAEYDIIRTTYSDSVVGHDDRLQLSAFFYF